MVLSIDLRVGASNRDRMKRLRHMRKDTSQDRLAETEWVALVGDPIKIEHRLVRCSTKEFAISD